MPFRTIGNLDVARYDASCAIFNDWLIIAGGYTVAGVTPVATGTVVKAKAGVGGSITNFVSCAPPITALGNLRSLIYNNFVFLGTGNADSSTPAITYSGLVATLAYKTQTTFYLAYTGGTGAFTVGQTVTGGTSAATGVIAAKTGTTSAGTLTLTSLSGTFQASETITDPITGSATATGAQVRATFTAGATVTGGTSGATAHIVSDANSGATGTLTVNTTSGTFQANEDLTDSATGIAVVNTPVHGVFTVGKTITGGTSAATAVILTDTDHGNATGTLTLTTVSGTFQSGETITDAAGVSGSATTTSALIVGGTVQQFLSGQVNSSGEISFWKPVSLPAELINYQMWGWRNWIYLAGGSTAALANNTLVYRAEINGDGTLGAWATVGYLPAACVENTNVTTIQGNVLNMVVGAQVWTAVLAGDGTVSPWTKTTLVTTINAPSVIRMGNTLIAIGGKDGSSNTLKTTSYVRLNPKGIPQSNWIPASNLVTARSAHCLAVDGAAVWVVGGLDSSGAVLSSIELDIVSGAQVP